MRQIDINCDMGEGVGNEAALMPLISSCNIACAAHAGSVATIDETIALAKKNQVKIGAHPGFADRANFGRKILNISAEELQESIMSQIQLLKNRAALQGVSMNHIKMHGALYNLSALDNEIAKVVVQAVAKTTQEVLLYVPYNSEIERVAKVHNIPIFHEVFIDRNYNDDLTLVSRTQQNALIHDVNIALSHVVEIVNNQNIKTVSGNLISIKADTFCVHGDNKNTIEILEFLSKQLKSFNIEIV